MKSIIISDRNGALSNVYSYETLDFLCENAGLDRKFLTSGDIRNNLEGYKDVKYIFTTWGYPVFTEKEIDDIFPSLECIFYGAGTVQYFARPYIKRGIKVFSAWAANAVPVAEYTVAQITLANKGFYLTSRYQSVGDSAKARNFMNGYAGNYDVNVGIIGAGMIGKMVIKELKRHKLNILVFDPFLPDETAEELGVTKCSLDYLFENCFVISNHLANNEQTKGMLGGELFGKMMQYATFINTGRGAQVVEEDLIRVLTERPDITAILDVTEPEPPVKDSPFYTLSNCILTPHIAGSLGNEVHRMSEYMKDEFIRYENGEKCLYEVTEKMLETMA